MTIVVVVVVIRASEVEKQSGKPEISILYPATKSLNVSHMLGPQHSPGQVNMP